MVGRVSISAGFPRSSPHAELVSKDGYDLGARVGLDAAFSALPVDWLAVGVYGGVWRRADDGGGGPTLRETLFRVGGEVAVPIQAGTSVLMLVGPEVGVARGTLSAGDGGQAQSALEYGAMFGLYGRVSRHFYLGGTASYLLAPADPPSALGRDWDWGGFYLGLTGVLGDGS